MRSSSRYLAGLVVLAASASGMAVAQPTLSPQGGGSIDMDHSRMGGSTTPRPGGPAPALTTQGQGTGGGDMDHRRMGGSGDASSAPGQRPIDQGGPRLSPSGQVQPGGSGGSSSR